MSILTLIQVIILGIPSFIISIPSRIIWLIQQPYKVYLDFKDNGEYFQLVGMRAVHGRAKGNAMMKEKLTKGVPRDRDLEGAK